MKNNKGFAISSIIYLILIMAIIIVTLILSILFSRNLILESQKSKLIEDIEIAQINSMYTVDFNVSSSLQLFEVPRTGYYKIEMCATGTESNKGDCTSGIIILKNDTKLYFDINSTSSSLRISNDSSSNNNIIMLVGSNSYISGYIGDDSDGYSTAYIFSNPEKTSDVNSSNGYAKATYISPISQLYNYTGGVEEFTAPVSGYYKLEVWGAQGGNSLCNGAYSNCQTTNTLNGIGGYGGYSTGIVYLVKDQTIYIYVGGKGADAIKGQDSSGGYNGGGTGTWDSSDDESAGGGGGATHIALTQRGVLSNYELYKDDVLIVAGGGGGAEWKFLSGAGGGFIGTYESSSGGYNALYGSQTSETIKYKKDKTDTGTNTVSTLFGQGLDGNGVGDNDGTSGGGGGWYGGTMGGYKYSSAGGSGYIGNSSLSNKVMYCYNCTESTDSDSDTYTISTTEAYSSPISNTAKIGDGAAKITFAGDDYLDLEYINLTLTVVE